MKQRNRLTRRRLLEDNRNEPSLFSINQHNRLFINNIYSPQNIVKIKQPKKFSVSPTKTKSKLKQIKLISAIQQKQNKKNAQKQIQKQSYTKKQKQAQLTSIQDRQSNNTISNNKLFKLKSCKKIIQIKQPTQQLNKIKAQQDAKDIQNQKKQKKQYQQYKQFIFNYYSQNKNNAQDSNNQLQVDFKGINHRLNTLEQKMVNMRSKINDQYHSKFKLKNQNIQSTDKILLNSENFRQYMSKYENYEKQIIQINKQPLNNHIQLDISHNNPLFFKANPYNEKSHYYISHIIKGYKNKNHLVHQHIKDSIYFLNTLQNQKQKQCLQEIMRIRNKVGLKRKLKINQKTLVLDLDETLIHTILKQEKLRKYKQIVEFKDMCGDKYSYQCSIRPNAQNFLRALSKNFQIFVFTASDKYYAQAICDLIDPQRKYIQYIFHRDHCISMQLSNLKKERIKVKDLRVIDRQLSQIVLIDNAPYSYAFQIDNAIPIIPYYGQQNQDFQLQKLFFYLQNKILPANDVRQVNRKYFRINQYLRYKNVQHLVQDLYKPISSA